MIHGPVSRDTVAHIAEEQQCELRSSDAANHSFISGRHRSFSRATDGRLRSVAFTASHVHVRIGIRIRIHITNTGSFRDTVTDPVTLP